MKDRTGSKEKRCVLKREWNWQPDRARDQKDRGPSEEDVEAYDVKEWRRAFHKMGEAF